MVAAPARGHDDVVDRFRALLTTLLFAFGVLLLVEAMSPSEPKPRATTFSQFLTQVERGEVDEVLMRTRDNSLRVKLDRGSAYQLGYPPEYGGDLLDELRVAGVGVDVEPAGQRWWVLALRIALPIALLAGLWFVIIRRASG